MAVATRLVEYRHDDAVLEGYFAWNDSIKEPVAAVLVAHAWGGRDEFVCEKARQLAGLGYAAFALDMYGKGVSGSDADENAALMQPFMVNREKLQARMKQASEILGAQREVDSSRLAAIGYCFGGLCVLDLARTGIDLSGIVSFHGLFSVPANTLGNRIRARILLLHGEDDPMVPSEDVAAVKEELSAAGCDWQLHVYGNTMHAFTNPLANDPGFGTVYKPLADTRSWTQLTGFLDEIFAQ